MQNPASLSDHDQAISVRFWGVRGSHPVPGPRTVEFGGNTSCVEVRLGGRLFVLDAGTGIAALGHELSREDSRDITLLLTHLHPDHVGGLPFFKPLLTGDCHARIFCGNLGGETAESALDRCFGPPLFPIRLGDLKSHIEHVGFKAGQTLTFGNISVGTFLLVHPSGATAYRFDLGSARFAYVTDIEHVADEPDPALVEFVRGADLVVYDAMYTEEEFSFCRGWGHSTWPAGVALCRAGGVKRLAAFHHHPKHDDAKLLDFERQLQAEMPGSFFAREGQQVTIGQVTN